MLCCGALRRRPRDQGLINNVIMALRWLLSLRRHSEGRQHSEAE